MNTKMLSNKKTTKELEIKINQSKAHVDSSFYIDFKFLCSFALFLPLFAFFSCILLSILKDFENANQTHCGVYNVLPSISSSISSFYPQMTIWRLLIGIDSFPRYIIALIYHSKYYNCKTDLVKHKTLYKFLIKTAVVFHFIELTALLLLTYISSIEIFVLHKLSFIFFLASSTIYMILIITSYYCLYLHKDSNDNQLMSAHRESNSKKYKIRLFIIYLSSLVFSLYFYIRHNVYCEPYVYSFFSFFEYVTVLANIGFHSVIFYDLNLFNSQYKISLIESNKND